MLCDVPAGGGGGANGGGISEKLKKKWKEGPPSPCGVWGVGMPVVEVSTDALRGLASLTTLAEPVALASCSFVGTPGAVGDVIEDVPPA